MTRFTLVVLALLGMPAMAAGQSSALDRGSLLVDGNASFVSVGIEGADTRTTTFAVRPGVKYFYQLLSDDRDFLVVLEAGMRAGATASGMAVHVRQDVRGIGASTGPRSSAYGSAARLQMVVQINRSLYASNAPSGYCLLSHELNHRWAAFIGAPLASSAHWDLETLARGSSAFGVNGSCLMNDLELYLAGLLPPTPSAHRSLRTATT